MQSAKAAREFATVLWVVSMAFAMGCNTNGETPVGVPGPTPPLPIAVSATTTTLLAGQSMTLTAVVNVQATSDELKWTISPAGFGTLNSTSANPVIYTAPDVVATATVVTITATLVGNPSDNGGWRFQVLP